MEDSGIYGGVASIAHEALLRTRQLLSDSSSGNLEGWADSADSRSVIVTPNAVVSGDEAEGPHGLFSSLGSLLRNVNPDALLYHVHLIGVDTCSIIVSRTWPADETLSRETPPRAILMVLVWLHQDGRLVLRQCCVDPQQGGSSADAVAAHGQASSQTSRSSSRTSGRVQFRTADGETHWVQKADIVYAKANRQYTELHCNKRMLNLHALFKDVLLQLGPTFVRVHRSYAVNPRYADSMRGEMLYLSTGEKVPIPSRRIKEVRSLLGQSI